MAALNARSDSFIALLLDVSGRARPTDLQGMAPAEASEALRQFAAAHPERGLTFEGETLVPAAAAQATTPAPPLPAAVDDGMFEFGPADAAVAPAAAPVPASIAPAVAPQAGEIPSWPAADAPSSDDFLNLPPLEGVGDAADIAPRVPIYWWLLAVMFNPLGGLAGWFVLKKRNPRGARNVLLVSIAATVLSVVLVAGALFLGLGSLLGMASVEPVPVAPVPASVSTTGASESAPAGAEATETP